MVNMFYENAGLVLRSEIWNPLDTTAGIQLEGDKTQTKHLYSYNKTLVDTIWRKKSIKNIDCIQTEKAKM